MYRLTRTRWSPACPSVSRRVHSRRRLTLLLCATRGALARRTHARPRLLTPSDTVQDVLLRGCKLKNSDTVLGVALCTGPDTRIQLNTRRAPFKAGAFDKFLQVQITALILLQVALCVCLALHECASTLP